MRWGEDDEFSWFFRLLPIGLALIMAAFLLFRSPPPSPPANALVFGCYSTPNAPAILLDVAGMHISQGGFPVIGFHLERHNTGIDLVAEAPIRADRSTDGYRYAINRRGVGWFLPFYREQNGRIYGVFDERALNGFRMLASDGAWLDYRPADPPNCITS